MAATIERADPEVPTWVLSVLVAASQAIVVALIVAIGSGDVGQHRAGAYLFAAGFGALLLARRGAPRTVLVAAIASVFVYYALGYPPIGMAIPVFGAFYAVAQRGRIAFASGAGIVLLAVSLYFRTQDGESSSVLAYDVVTNAALIGCAIALAIAVRNHRALNEQHRRVLALERRNEQERAARQIQAERVQIARDVHDSVGHALSLVSVQARVAQQALGEDEEAVGRALDNVVATTGSSLTDLRRTIALLHREPGATERAPLTLAGIERTAQAARDAGLDVQVRVDTDGEFISAATASTAFRIVQESLTNVLRHARAHEAEVRIRIDGDDLHLRIADDGRVSTPTTSTDGQGIMGMRERAALLGGTLSTESTPSGFIVQAVLPLRGSR